MPGGLSDELAALHARRASAEQEIKEVLFGWAMEHCDTQTFDAIRQLNDDLRDIVSRAVLDTYNLPRPGDAPRVLVRSEVKEDIAFGDGSER